MSFSSVGATIESKYSAERSNGSGRSPAAGGKKRKYTNNLVNPPPGGGNSFSNLDIISGKIHMTLKSETSIKSVIVKLEGISKTSVPIPEEADNRHKHKRRNSESKRMSIEIHHVLYKTQTVFPPEDVRKSSSSNQFTLPAGSYSYDFKFKIPVNSDCRQNSNGAGGSSETGNSTGWIPGGPNSPFNSIANGRIGSSLNNFADRSLPGQGNKLIVSKTGVDVARKASYHSHVDGILPPSLSGLNDSGTIKYFVKVTVARASLLKVNTRSYKPFIFLPLDPPRLYDSNKMAFVRRQITVGTNTGESGSSKSSGSKSGGGFFSQLLGSQKVSSFMGVNSWPGETLTFTFEMRFPSAGTFVPLRPLPLELFAIFPASPTSMTRQKSIRISSIDIILYARTAIRAHEYDKEVPLQLKVSSQKNLSIPINLAEAEPIKRNGDTIYELKLPSNLLDGVQFPDYVCPTFTTCNIARSYSIGVEVGFYCVEGIPVDHVALLSEIVVRSGIDPPSTNSANNAGAPPPPQKPPRPVQRPEKSNYSDSSLEQTADLPSYDDVVAETSTSFQEPPRRNFDQSPDYYKIDYE